MCNIQPVEGAIARGGEHRRDTERAAKRRQELILMHEADLPRGTDQARSPESTWFRGRLGDRTLPALDFLRPATPCIRRPSEDPPVLSEASA